VLIAPDGRFAVALLNEGARIVSLDADASMHGTLPGVTQVALIGNEEIAFADASEVRIASLATPGDVRATRAFPVGVSSVAADVHGQLFAGLADGSIAALGEHGEPDRILARLPNAARRLVASPGGRWLVALDAEAHPTFIATRSGELRRADAWLRMHAFAFVNEEQLVFTTSEEDPSALALSLERLETEPFFNHGRTITALAAAPGAADAAIALGGDLHLVGAPVPGLHAYASSSVRLVQRGYF
jgi:hypothetical protein